MKTERLFQQPTITGGKGSDTIQEPRGTDGKGAGAISVTGGMSPESGRAEAKTSGGIVSGLLRSLTAGGKGEDKVTGELRSNLAKLAPGDGETATSAQRLMRYVDAGVLPTGSGFTDAQTGSPLSNEQVQARLRGSK